MRRKNVRGFRVPQPRGCLHQLAGGLGDDVFDIDDSGDVKLLPLLFAGCLLAPRLSAAPFTYQGRLDDTSGPANGNYDLRFGLFTASSGSSASITITNLNVPLADGLFTTTLDFGGSVFNGASYWLEISVRTNGGGQAGETAVST